MMNNKKVSFLGLGTMGYPMAGHLSKQGYNTKVYNRTESKSTQWCAQYEGVMAKTPKQLAENCDFVALCVGNDNDVRSIFYGDDGVLSGLKAGAILVDHTTTSAELALELAAACKSINVKFIDAPVSGGQSGAENGQLTIMCGGDIETYQEVQTIFNCYSKHSMLLGENGKGQLCKMINQICISGVLAGLSEAVLLSQKVGLNIEDVVNTIKHGAAGSWQMENRATTMANDKFDFGFAIDWMIKDLNICLEQAKKHDLSLPITEEVNNNYKKLQKSGCVKDQEF